MDEAAKKKLEEVKEETQMNRKYVEELSHIVVDTLVNDLVKTSSENFDTLKRNMVNKNISDVKSIFKNFNGLKLGMQKEQYIIRKLFEAYCTHPQQLPDGPILHFMVDVGKKYKNIDEAKKVGIGEVRVEFSKIIKNPTIYVQCMLMRRICDHIASMTDHYAIEEYNNLYG